MYTACWKLLFIAVCPYTEGSYFLSDPGNLCVFYWCVAGSLVVDAPLWCAEGSAVKPGFQGADNPCTWEHPSCEGSGDGGDSYEPGSDGGQTGGGYGVEQGGYEHPKGHPQGRTGDGKCGWSVISACILLDLGLIYVHGNFVLVEKL